MKISSAHFCHDSNVRHFYPHFHKREFDVKHGSLSMDAASYSTFILLDWFQFHSSILLVKSKIVCEIETDDVDKEIHTLNLKKSGTQMLEKLSRNAQVQL